MAISSDLKIVKMLDGALRGFTPVMRSLAATFTTRFNESTRPIGTRGDDVVVPYYPIESAASSDFVDGTGYVFTSSGPNANARKVAITSRKYQPLIVSSAELNRSNFELGALGELKGRKLAQDVFADIMSLITSSNYGAAALTGAAGTFDYDDVVDLGAVADAAHWPTDMRSLVTKATYLANLKKDGVLKDASAFGSASAVRDGTIGRVGGFDVVDCEFIPANSQNLVGFIAYPSAILVATSPIQPSDKARALIDYQIVADEETGISFEYRSWFDEDLDAEKWVVECNYGKLAGEAAAIKRIVSA